MYYVGIETLTAKYVAKNHKPPTDVTAIENCIK